MVEWREGGGTVCSVCVHGRQIDFPGGWMIYASNKPLIVQILPVDGGFMHLTGRPQADFPSGRMISTSDRVIRDKNTQRVDGFGH